MLVACGGLMPPYHAYFFSVHQDPGLPRFYRAELLLGRRSIAQIEGPTLDGVMTMLDEAAQRHVETTVSLGERALDDALSPTWDSVIDTQELDLASAQVCLLGQLNRAGLLNADVWTSPYVKGLNALENALDRAIDPEEYGFSGRNRQHFPVLTQVWIEHIQRRRAARTATP